jgi:hypothetical protein
MSALSHDVQRPVRLPTGGLATAVLKLAGYTNRGGGSEAFTVYKGAVVMCDVTDTDGYFGPKDMNAADGDIFGGLAAEHQEVTSGDTSDGAKTLTVYRNGVWGFAKGSIAITDIGATAYVSTDNDVTTTNTNAIPIGTIEDVDDTYVWVNIAPAFMAVRAES